MSSLDQLLSRVVERKGFSVQGADAEALFARKGDETLLAAWKLDAPLTAGDAQIFLSAMEQVRAATGILVAPKGAEQAAKDAVQAAKGVEIWAESRLVLEVGEAYVKDALDRRAGLAPPAQPAPAPAPAKTPTKFPSLVAQAATAASSASSSGAAYFMPNRKKEAPADMQAQIPQRGGSLGYAWGGPGAGGSSHNAGIAQVRNGRHPSKQVDQWGNLIDPNNPRPGQLPAPNLSGAAAAESDVEITAAPKKRANGAKAQTAAPPMPAMNQMVAEPEAYEIITTSKKPAGPAMKDAAPPACTTLKLNVTKEEAVAKTGKAGNAKLALVPHVAFEYDLVLNRPGMTAPVTGKGAILASSLTGELRSADALDFNASEPADARKDAEKLTAVDLYDKVKAHLTKTYSRTLSVEREVAGNTVMENLKLVPDPEEMGLEHKGMVLLPVWEVTGSTGITKVDAFTGAILGQ